jgi:probable rRNA maturation factor
MEATGLRISCVRHPRTPPSAYAAATRGLRRRLRQTAARLGVARGSWVVTLVGDGAMADLHARTMNLPTTTDVLTFDLSDGSVTNHKRAGFVLDLDTILCVDEARRQAAARGHTLAAEVLLYAIHSLLHVCGYDDQTADEARRMHRREDALLNELGVGPVYHSEHPSPRTHPSRDRKGATPKRSKPRDGSLPNGRGSDTTSQRPASRSRA